MDKNITIEEFCKQEYRKHIEQTNKYNRAMGFPLAEFTPWEQLAQAERDSFIQTFIDMAQNVKNELGL